MSLFNNIAVTKAKEGLDALSKNGGVTGIINNGGGSIIDGASGSMSDSVANAFGGGFFAQVAAKVGGGLASKYAKQGLSKLTNLIPDSVLHYEKMLLDWYNGHGSSASNNEKFLTTKNKLFGGITPKDAIKIHKDMMGLNLAKKNLFLVSVKSNLLGDAEGFNLFVTSIDYAPLTMTGEKIQVGASSVDTVKSGEPVEMKMTTLDDEEGTVKKWFTAQSAATVHQDGTVGVPFEYAIEIDVLHAFVKDNDTGYRDKGIYRPANMDVSLSRSDKGLAELTLTFNQLDTFITP